MQVGLIIDNIFEANEPFLGNLVGVDGSERVVIDPAQATAVIIDAEGISTFTKYYSRLRITYWECTSMVECPFKYI